MRWGRILAFGLLAGVVWTLLSTAVLAVVGTQFVAALPGRARGVQLFLLGANVAAGVWALWLDAGQRWEVQPMKHHDDRIDYIELGATDIPATKAFYSAAFGWKFTDYGPDYVAFEDGGMSGGFAKAPSVLTGGPLVILYSSALEKTQAAVVAQRGRISRPIFTFPGGRRFHFLDPNGNELAVWSDK